MNEVYLLDQESIAINNSKELKNFHIIFSSNYLKSTIICIIIVLLNDLSGYINIYSSPLIFAKFHEKNNPATQLLYIHIIKIAILFKEEKHFIFGLVYFSHNFNNKINIIILSSYYDYFLIFFLLYKVEL